MSHASGLIAAHALSSLGMDAAVLRESNVDRAIRRRMHAVSVTQTEEYAELYLGSPVEQTLLAEELYIHETFFFRDRTVFAELKRWCELWFAEHTEPMRILSAPCSTGEEPYSVAATLYELGVPPERYSIDAIDVSQSALDRAGSAIFSGLSLRNLPEDERLTILSRVAGGWQVRPHLRSAIRFVQANLLHPSAAEEDAYDLILCRNLLLYLDATARERLSANLLRWLRPGGRIILGSADWSRDLESTFRLEEPAASFAVRAVAAPIVSQLDERDPPAQGTGNSTTSAAVVLPRVGAAAMDEDAERIYERARVEFELQRHESAERFCRKALYLQPSHLPSLELLSCLWQSHASPRLNHALAARIRRHGVQGEI